MILTGLLFNVLVSADIHQINSRFFKLPFRRHIVIQRTARNITKLPTNRWNTFGLVLHQMLGICLLYTSDAADE